MTPQEFAQKIRDKYPESYNEIDDVELTQRIIAKYPVYAKQVRFEERARVKELRGEVEVAEKEAAIPTIKRFGKEFKKRIGEISGVVPTGERIAAGIAPYVVPEEELPGVVEELVGGVVTPEPSKLKEFGQIALDLPLISLGLSKNISKILSQQVTKLSTPQIISLLDKPLVEFAPEALRTLLKKEVPVEEVTEKIGEFIKLPIQKIKAMKPTEIIEKYKPSEIIEKTQNYFSRKNTTENFESSVTRLTDEQPLKKYNEFYEQEMKFKGDIKQDTAIGVVGGKIGNAYEKVIKMRRAVGKKMGSEVKKIGDIPTDINESFVKLESDLADSGIGFDLKKGKIFETGISKVTSEDKKLLTQYVTELNSLGADPSVAQLDAFLSRIPKEIDIFKAKRNVTTITNGERIVKSHLRELREVFNPKNNKAFTKYYKARQDYASLSKFLDEGSGFLGKKTQAGDFAKDASLAKSSVQSILNQGKKDWLLTLEDLTGYQALDESVLALQAMKDAGNFRGRSLLELMTEGRIPPVTTKGVLIRGIEKGAEITGRKVLGEPVEQTRRTIEEILKTP